MLQYVPARKECISPAFACTYYKTAKYFPQGPQLLTFFSHDVSKQRLLVPTLDRVSINLQQPHKPSSTSALNL
jgi:hypothetical protein